MSNRREKIETSSRRVRRSACVVAAALVLSAASGAASWSASARFPTGGLIVLGCEECETTQGLYAVAPDGRGFHLIRGTVGAVAPRWSPDGQTLAFAATAGVWLSRSDGSHQRLVARRAAAPSWSPDGRRLAYAGPNGLYALSLDTRRSRLILPMAAPDFFADPDWSPDGKRIVGWRGHDIAHLWLVDADGSHLRRLGPNSLEGQVPRWSPDGRRIAYADADSGTIDVLTLRTGRTRTVFSGAAEGDQSWALAWSPDGRWLAVAGWIRYGVDEGCEQPEEVGPCQEAGLWIVDAAGGRSKRILGFPQNYAFVSGLDWKSS